ncbi:MAG: ferritin [Bacteroidales bacterium]
MLTKKLEKVLNEQVEKEGYAAQLYLAMASWADSKGLEGISSWFYAQHMEEIEHMLKFIQYINERGGHAIVPKIDQPPREFKGIKQAFEASLEHEQMVTKSINNIVGNCLDEKDFTTHNWIQYFVDEQLEEESSVQGLLDKLDLLGEGNLYMFDRDIMAMRAQGDGEE